MFGVNRQSRIKRLSETQYCETSAISNEITSAANGGENMRRICGGGSWRTAIAHRENIANINISAGWRRKNRENICRRPVKETRRGSHLAKRAA